MASKLQLLQQFVVAGFGDGKQIGSTEDHAIYVGISNLTSILAECNEEIEDRKVEKENKKGKPSTAGKSS